VSHDGGSAAAARPDGHVRAARIAPVVRGPGGHAALAVHQHLRSLILGGAIAPGSILNQVELAPLLGVSRTPLREALRMLQEEGLVVAEPQKRARVASFDPEILESTYVQRMLLEGVAASVTAPTTTAADVEKLERLFAEMATHAGRDADAWADANRRFHLLLTAGVGPTLQATLEHLMARADHWLLSSLREKRAARAFDVVDSEHRAVIEAYRDRDAAAAGRALATHVAGAFFALAARLAPSYDAAVARATAAVFGRES